MRVWIEVEVSSSRYNQYEVRDNWWFSFETFAPHVNLPTHIQAKMSEEYYNTTCEYNFTPFESCEEDLDSVKRFMEKEIEVNGLSLSSPKPSFVWTHVHIFDEWKLRMNKRKILAWLLSYILDNLEGLEIDSLLRLVEWHQLWTYWSWKNDHEWKDAVERFGNGDRPEYYEHNSDKMKYQPIIISPETTRGKPKSLEIRLIPNEYLFDKRLWELLEEVNTRKLYTRREVWVEEFVEKIYARIAEKRGENRRRRRRRSEDERATTETNNSELFLGMIDNRYPARTILSSADSLSLRGRDREALIDAWSRAFSELVPTYPLTDTIKDVLDFIDSRGTDLGELKEFEESVINALEKDLTAYCWIWVYHILRHLKYLINNN